MATIEEKIRVLTEEVRNYETAIDVINGRIADLKLEAAAEMSVSEQMQEELEPLPKSYDYEEEQARLRRIQDSAAGRSDTLVNEFGNEEPLPINTFE